MPLANTPPRRALHIEKSENETLSSIKNADEEEKKEKGLHYIESV